MNEPRNGWPSTVPVTLTSPRVPKNSAEPGHTTYVCPPLAGLFTSVAVNSLSILSDIAPSLRRLPPYEVTALEGDRRGRSGGHEDVDRGDHPTGDGLYRRRL